MTAAQLVDRVPGLRDMVVDLLRLADAGILGGVWPLMDTIRQTTAPILAAAAPDKDAAPERYRSWGRARGDTSVSWWRIHVTDLLFAVGQDVWEAGLRKGVISAADVEYKLAGWPRTRGSATGARRREILKRAHALSVVTRLEATYNATGLLP